MPLPYVGAADATRRRPSRTGGDGLSTCRRHAKLIVGAAYLCDPLCLNGDAKIAGEVARRRVPRPFECLAHVVPGERVLPDLVLDVDPEAVIFSKLFFAPDSSKNSPSEPRLLGRALPPRRTVVVFPRGAGCRARPPPITIERIDSATASVIGRSTEMPGPVMATRVFQLGSGRILVVHVVRSSIWARLDDEYTRIPRAPSHMMKDWRRGIAHAGAYGSRRYPDTPVIHRDVLTCVHRAVIFVYLPFPPHMVPAGAQKNCSIPPAATAAVYAP